MSIVNYLRTAFSRRDNALNQLLLINLLVFVVLIVIKAVTFSIGLRAGQERNRTRMSVYLTYLTLPTMTIV